MYSALGGREDHKHATFLERKKDTAGQAVREKGKGQVSACAVLPFLFPPVVAAAMAPVVSLRRRGESYKGRRDSKGRLRRQRSGGCDGSSPRPLQPRFSQA